MTRSKSKKGKLEKKVIKVKPLEDEWGRYVPFCDLYYHRGVIRTKRTVGICEERGCYHYKRLYLL